MPSSDRVAGYATLVSTFGPEAVADKLLAKWLADPDAGQKWERLGAAVNLAEFELAKRPRAPATLTPAEVAVLTLRANGHGSHASGRLLRKSPETIKKQLATARQRLGARNLCHAVTLAYRQGILLHRDIADSTVSRCIGCRVPWDRATSGCFNCLERHARRRRVLHAQAA